MAAIDTNDQPIITWLEWNLCPYKEAAERIHRAVNGVIPGLLLPSPNLIPFSQRVVYLITGISLFIPFINLLIWETMKVYGNPERLYQPVFAPLPSADPLPQPRPGFARAHASEVEAADADSDVDAQDSPAPSPPPSPGPAPLAAVADPAPQPTVIIYRKTKSGETTTSTLTIHPGRAERTEANGREVSCFNADGNLVRYEMRMDPGFSITAVRNGNTITVNRTRQDEHNPNATLRTNAVWIQQFTVGFQSFVLSAETQLNFVMIRPDDLSLVNMKAKKESLGSEDPGVTKIVVTPNLIGGSWLWNATFWFDGEGNVIKATYKEPDNLALTQHGLRYVTLLTRASN